MKIGHTKEKNAGNYMGDLLEDVKEEVEQAKRMLTFLILQRTLQHKNETTVRGLSAEGLQSIRKMMTQMEATQSQNQPFSASVHSGTSTSISV